MEKIYLKIVNTLNIHESAVVKRLVDLSLGTISVNWNGSSVVAATLNRRVSPQKQVQNSLLFTILKKNPTGKTSLRETTFEAEDDKDVEELGGESYWKWHWLTRACLMGSYNKIDNLKLIDQNTNKKKIYLKKYSFM